MRGLERPPEDWTPPPSGRIRLSIPLPASPEVVFDTLLDPASWPRFFPGIRRVTYLDEPPYRAGTRRVVQMPGVRFRERFDVVERPWRWSFHHEASTTSLATRFRERYVLTPDGEGTRLTWAVDVAPRRLAAPLVPVAMPALRALFRRGAANLAELLSQSGAR